MTGLFKYAMMHFVIEKSVEFYIFSIIIKEMPKTNRGKCRVVNKPIKETRDNRGFTIIGITDFLLRYIK